MRIGFSGVVLRPSRGHREGVDQGLVIGRDLGLEVPPEVAHSGAWAGGASRWQEAALRTVHSTAASGTPWERRAPSRSLFSVDHTEQGSSDAHAVREVYTRV